MAISYNKRGDEVEVGGKWGSDTGHRLQWLLRAQSRIRDGWKCQQRP